MTTIPTTKATHSALLGSIKKWTNIVQEFENGEQINEGGIDDCPLCQLFHPYGNRRALELKTGCKNCPIKRDTGKDFCANTPYEDWSEDQPESETQENAEAMLSYLGDLLEKTVIQENELVSPT